MIRRSVVSLAGWAIMLMAAVGVRADSLSPPAEGDAAANGYWSFQPYQTGADPGSPFAITLTGSGEISGMSLGAWSTPATGPVVTDLTWQPDQFTLGPDYGPILVTWTALSPGEFTVTASLPASQVSSGFALGASSGSAVPFDSGLSPADASNPFCETMTFGVGDTIGFVAKSGGSADRSPGGLVVNFGSPLPAPVPEPSDSLALLGMLCVVLAGAVWTVQRNRGHGLAAATTVR